jgi:transposase InsO family protein
MLKLGIQLSQATVAKYMVRQRKPPSQTWRTFRENHVKQLVATDFLVVPTVTFRLLFVFVVLGHDRRRAIHFNVTAHPTAEWTARQIAEAFPWDSAPRYLLHDRDSIYGGTFRQQVEEMGIREVLTAPKSPWQNPYAERFIGSLRRECLDHIVVMNEASLRRIVRSISNTTSTHGHIWRWRKTRQNPEPFNLRQRVSLWNCRRWVGCIIATSEELPESTDHSGQLSSLHLNSLKCRASLIATMVSSCLRH